MTIRCTQRQDMAFGMLAGEFLRRDGDDLPREGYRKLRPPWKSTLRFGLAAHRDERLSGKSSSMIGRTPEHDAVDKMFRVRAENALSAAGYTALELLAENPAVSVVELAKKLNRGASAIGIVMAIYQEALKQGIVRRIAKDLLIREALAEFPDGWARNENVHPVTKIGGWSSEVGYSGSQKYETFAENIVRSLAIDNPQPEGWKPQYPNAPIIDRLFDVHWPAEQD